MLINGNAALYTVAYKLKSRKIVIKKKAKGIFFHFLRTGIAQFARLR